MARRVGIDVGNTRVKVHEIPGTPPPRPAHLQWIEDCETRVIESRDPEAIVDAVAAVAAESTLVHVSSVDPRLSQTVVETLRRRGCDVIEWRPGACEVPLAQPYEDPTTLGPDRLVAAFAAHRLLPDEDVCVIDAGTAITVDVVSGRGAFLGGAIAPGRRLAAEALASRGAMLIDPGDAPAGEYPGTSTAACLALGVRAAFAGALGHLAEAARSRWPGVRFVVTGGDARQAARVLESRGLRSVCVPGLNHLGLALLAHHGE